MRKITIRYEDHRQLIEVAEIDPTSRPGVLLARCLAKLADSQTRHIDTGVHGDLERVAQAALREVGLPGAKTREETR